MPSARGGPIDARSRRFRLAEGFERLRDRSDADPGPHRRAAARLPVQSRPPGRVRRPRDLRQQPVRGRRDRGRRRRAAGLDRGSRPCLSRPAAPGRPRSAPATPTMPTAAEAAARALKQAGARQGLSDGPAGRGAARRLGRRPASTSSCMPAPMCWRRSSAPHGGRGGRGRMSTIPSFADLPLGARAADAAAGRRRSRRTGHAPEAAGLGDARRHRRAAALHRGRHRPASTSSTPGRACRRSCAAPTPPCTRPSPGRSGNMPASPRPRTATPSTAATSPPGRRACRSPSTSPPTAATTATTRASRAMSAWPGSRSIRSSTWRSCSRASRSTG